MKRRQIYLAEEQIEQLKRLAKIDRSTVSGLVRDAITAYLARNMTPASAGIEAPGWTRIEDHPLWGIVGIIKSGELPVDASASIDEDVYDLRPGP